MRLAQLQAEMSGFLIDAPANGFAETMGDRTDSKVYGLAVYRNNYRGQLLTCLRDTFERCWAWLGDDGFESASSAHIDRHPPSSWTLDAYGHDFAETLNALFPEDHEVAELAWLDWAMRRAFDGLDHAPLDPATLGDVDWDTVRFELVPTLEIGTVTTNAAAIWTALANDRDPPAVECLPRPATIFVWRKDLAPCFRSVEDVEARLMRLALGGTSFGKLCVLLTAEMEGDEATTKAGAILGQWLQDELIASLA